jgi:ribosomal protein L11 methyltransferase
VDGDDYVEFALYGAPGELPDLPAGRARIGALSVEVSTSSLGDDWADRWREFHRPAQIGAIRVRAPWHEPAEDGIEIVIDPGRAFGTGAHATTRLCIELLQELEPVGPLADLGSGSGVLAIAAA